ncbi:MAG: peptide chain release factor N(5)-glutamine methyltransferase [Terracidiphilus sp.]
MRRIGSFVLDGTARLRLGPHPERARADAELLLLYLLGKDKAWLGKDKAWLGKDKAWLGKDKAWLMTHGDELLDDISPSYTELLERRLRGEPIQYILGEMEFYGLPFHVTPEVLIPRPETEHLVEKTLESASALTAPRIVDIGTGSGAIAVTLAYKLPQAHVTAIDLSAPALAAARENAKRNGVAIRFLEGDLLTPVAGEQFEFIVSNPPYVPAADRATLSVEVREHEPALALFAGEDGLEIYRRLIPTAFAALVSGGILLLEIGFGQSSAIREMLTSAGFVQIEFVSDLQGIPRVASARRP